MLLQRIKDSFGKTPRFFQLGWILVILGSVVLRFVGIEGRAWGYDELSAVFRAMSTSHNWHAHLERGVAVDGHPAGLQTIIWWWISVADSDVLWPRIFTALFSIGVIWQFHRMAKNLFGYEAAFWAVAMMGLMWWQVNMGVVEFGIGLIKKQGFEWRCFATQSDGLVRGEVRRRPGGRRLLPLFRRPNGRRILHRPTTHPTQNSNQPFQPYTRSTSLLYSIPARHLCLPLISTPPAPHLCPISTRRTRMA